MSSLSSTVLRGTRIQISKWQTRRAGAVVARSLVSDSLLNMTTTTLESQPFEQHEHLAARRPAGTLYPVTTKKQGCYHTQRLPDGSEREIIACGLACSEVFSGANLARILQPGLDYELQVMKDLTEGKPADPLWLHTSSGLVSAMDPFIDALALHLPWKEKEGELPLDWCVSLQVEGASAVWAAVDMVLQVSMLERPEEKQRIKVAVGATSYHGPPSTSFGAKSPLWQKNHQCIYPVPTAYGDYDEAELLQKYKTFLDDHAHEIGAILLEPQWGSSQAALPWPEHLLKTYVRMARERGIKIIMDEIMCGLGRHGKGTLFVSEAWDLDPDAVTFGKAVATGLFPLSGAVLKRGRDILQANKCSVMQSHTYAGSHVRALMAATEGLKEFVIWLPSVAHLGEEMSHIMKYLTEMSEGMFICHGQGLMWGGIVSYAGQNHDPAKRAHAVEAFKRHCEDVAIMPYFVPVGGFMCTPVIDIDVAAIYEIGNRLEEAIKRTKAEVNWAAASPVGSTPASTPAANPIASASTLNLAAMAEMGQHGSAPRAPIYSLSTVKLAELGRMANERGSLRMDQDLGNDKCVPYLHATKCCTTCGSFVCKETRDKFLSVKENVSPPKGTSIPEDGMPFDETTTPTDEAISSDTSVSDAPTL